MALTSRGFLGAAVDVLLRGFTGTETVTVTAGTIAERIDFTSADQDIAFAVENRQIGFIERNRTVGADDG